MTASRKKIFSQQLKKSFAVLALALLLLGGFESQAETLSKKSQSNPASSDGGDGANPKLGGDGGGRPK